MRQNRNGGKDGRYRSAAYVLPVLPHPLIPADAGIQARTFDWLGPRVYRILRESDCLHNAAASSNPPARWRGGWRRAAAPGGGTTRTPCSPRRHAAAAMSAWWIDVVLMRLATCATAEFGRPRHHRNVTVRVVPPPRRLAARGIDPPRQRAGGSSPRCRRSEQEPPYAIALPFQGEGFGNAVPNKFVRR